MTDRRHSITPADQRHKWKAFETIDWFRQLDLAHFDTFIWPTPEPVFWIESFNKAEQSSTSGSTPLIFQPSSFYHEPASKMRVAGGG